MRNTTTAGGLGQKYGGNNHHVVSAYNNESGDQVLFRSDGFENNTQ